MARTDEGGSVTTPETPALSVPDLIKALMSDGKPRTSREISDETDRPGSQVRTYMAKSSKPGPFQKYHTIDRTEINNAARFVIGPGENAGPRVRTPPKELTEEELDRKHKSSGRWWPQADSTVLDSINAMVRQGARA
jgi:hypothetical protein